MHILCTMHAMLFLGIFQTVKICFISNISISVVSKINYSYSQSKILLYQLFVTMDSTNLKIDKGSMLTYGLFQSS